jgi:hypothetical protein
MRIYHTLGHFFDIDLQPMITGPGFVDEFFAGGLGVFPAVVGR